MRVMNWENAKGGQFTIRFAIKLILLCIPISDITWGTLIRMTDAHDAPGVTDWLCELAIAVPVLEQKWKKKQIFSTFVCWLNDVSADAILLKVGDNKIEGSVVLLGLLIFISTWRIGHLWLVGVYRTWSRHPQCTYLYYAFRCAPFQFELIVDLFLISEFSFIFRFRRDTCMEKHRPKSMRWYRPQRPEPRHLWLHRATAIMTSYIICCTKHMPTASKRDRWFSMGKQLRVHRHCGVQRRPVICKLLNC